jgi:hypothetical protein
MTNEEERLRAEIAQLRAKLASQTEDPRKAAFIRAGCSESSADDAVRCARISGNKAANLWKVNDVPVESLEAAVTEFLEAHAWFRTNHTAAEPEVEDNRPRYADGSLVPADKLTEDELWRAAGSPPEPAKAKEPARSALEWELMSDTDREFAKAGPPPEVPATNPEADEAWAADVDRQYQYKLDSNREQVERLKQAGARIDVPVPELKSNK